MPLRLLIALLVAFARTSGALAQAPAAFDEKAFPPEVWKSLKYAHDECRREGGGRVTFAPDTVRMLDLTGDGRDDYIVSLEDTDCTGRPSTYCGTGGCTLDIIVTLAGGKHRNVFSMRVLQYTIQQGEGARQPKTVRFDLHGAYCGKSGGTECAKTKEITAKPFDFRQPK